MKLPAAAALACCALLLLCIGTAEAKQFYRDRIPNGHNVPNPCDTSTTWQGVGHWNSAGGGARNPFGVAFAANGHVWNTTICQMDSDGDGRTNGVELGDPNCVWVVGAAPSQTTGLTHPGVCEPVTSENCKTHNGDNISCGAAALQGTLSLLCCLLFTALMLR